MNSGEQVPEDEDDGGEDEEDDEGLTEWGGRQELGDTGNQGLEGLHVSSLLYNNVNTPCPLSTLSP